MHECDDFVQFRIWTWDITIMYSTFNNVDFRCRNIGKFVLQ